MNVDVPHYTIAEKSAAVLLAVAMAQFGAWYGMYHGGGVLVPVGAVFVSFLTLQAALKGQFWFSCYSSIVFGVVGAVLFDVIIMQAQLPRPHNWLIMMIPGVIGAIVAAQEQDS